MHCVGFRGHERPWACSCRRQRRYPLSTLKAVSEGLELPNGCDTLLVDVAHGTGSRILIDGPKAKLSNWRRQRCRSSYPQSKSELVCVTKFGVATRTNVCTSFARKVRKPSKRYPPPFETWVHGPAAQGFHRSAASPFSCDHQP